MTSVSLEMIQKKAEKVQMALDVPWGWAEDYIVLAVWEQGSKQHGYQQQVTERSMLIIKGQYGLYILMKANQGRNWL